MSLEDIVPFYDYFVGEEKASEANEDQSFLTWIFGKPEKSLPALPEDRFPSDSLSLSDNYANTIEEVVKVYGPNDAEKILQRININLCMTPFIATLVFLTFTYAAKTIYKSGRPFLLKLAAFIQHNLQEDDEKKINEMAMKMNFMESMIIKNIKIHQSECVEELKSKTSELIESHACALRSTHSRLCDITNSLHELIQVALPIRRIKSDEKELVDPEQSGDSSKQANCKN